MNLRDFLGEDIRLYRVKLTREDEIDELLALFMGKIRPSHQRFIIENLRRGGYRRGFGRHVGGWSTMGRERQAVSILAGRANGRWKRRQGYKTSVGGEGIDIRNSAVGK